MGKCASPPPSKKKPRQFKSYFIYKPWNLETLWYVLFLAWQSFFLVGWTSLLFLVKSWSPDNESWNKAKIKQFFELDYFSTYYDVRIYYYFIHVVIFLKKISIGKPPEGVSPKWFSYLSHVTQRHHKWVPYNI